MFDKSLAGFDVGDLSEDGPGDWEGLDASAAHIANFLSAEPSDGVPSLIALPKNMFT